MCFAGLRTSFVYFFTYLQDYVFEKYRNNCRVVWRWSIKTISESSFLDNNNIRSMENLFISLFFPPTVTKKKKKRVLLIWRVRLVQILFYYFLLLNDRSKEGYRIWYWQVKGCNGRKINRGIIDDAVSIKIEGRRFETRIARWRGGVRRRQPRRKESALNIRAT